MVKQRSQAGFTYVGLIITAAIVGLVAASTVKLGAMVQRRNAELALLETGMAFSAALQSYAAASAPGQNRSPASLQDLLLDKRSLAPRRHLRRIYADPITGSTEWGLVLDAKSKGIIGVHSLSDDRAIKVANFPAGLERLQGKKRLNEWIFMANAGAMGMP